MDIDKLFDTIALPAESPLEKILQTEISPLEVPKADLIPWDVNELTQKCGLASHEMAKKAALSSSVLAEKFNPGYIEKLTQSYIKDWSIPQSREIPISSIGKVATKESVLFEMEKAREEQEARRHKELLEALKEVAKSSGISIGDNATNIQIQQGTAGSSQTINNMEQAFDYEKAAKIIKDIASYMQYPQFAEAFGVNTEAAKEMIQSMAVSIERKEDQKLIKKLATGLKNLVIGVAENLIASGIVTQLKQLGI